MNNQRNNYAGLLDGLIEFRAELQAFLKIKRLDSTTLYSQRGNLLWYNFYSTRPRTLSFKMNLSWEAENAGSIFDWTYSRLVNKAFPSGSRDEREFNYKQFLDEMANYIRFNHSLLILDLYRGTKFNKCNELHYFLSPKAIDWIFQEVREEVRRELHFSSSDFFYRPFQDKCYLKHLLADLGRPIGNYGKKMDSDRAVQNAISNQALVGHYTEFVIGLIRKLPAETLFI